MANVDYEKIKQLILEKNPKTNVDAQVKAMREKLRTLSREGAILILANKMGVQVRADKPKSVIKTIDSLSDNDDFVEICGVVVQAYDLKFYEICPECGKRIRDQSGAFKCDTHGMVTSPAYGYLANIMLDDGSNSIRVTLFSKQIEKLLGYSAQQVLKLRESPQNYEELKNEFIGKILAFRGSVKSNTMTMRKEFNAKLVYKEPKDVEPRSEAVRNLIENTDKIPHSDDDDIDTENII